MQHSKLIVMFLSILITVLCIEGCDNGGFDNGEAVSSIILSNGSSPEDFVIDPYSIEGINLIDDTLYLIVSYSGGCANHEFQLVSYSYFMDSLPPQAAILLTHDANGDACKALISEELSFDLSPLKNAYQEEYPDDTTGKIILQLLDASAEDGYRLIEYEVYVN